LYRQQQEIEHRRSNQLQNITIHKESAMKHLSYYREQNLRQILVAIALVIALIATLYATAIQDQGASTNPLGGASSHNVKPDVSWNSDRNVTPNVSWNSDREVKPNVSWNSDRNVTPRVSWNS
jgi:hypothetical protein